MNCITLTTEYQKDRFLQYLKYNATDQSGSINTFQICIKCDNTTFLHPNSDTFEWKYDDEIFKIKIIEEGQPVSSVNCESSAVYFKRLKIYHDDIEKLHNFVKNAITYEEETDKVRILNGTSKGYWHSANSMYCQNLENIFIPKEQKDTLVNAINTFISSKDRYIKFGRKYSMGFLFSGVAGAGKTSLVKAISKKYKRNIYYPNFTKAMTDEVIFELMNDVKDDSIVLIEDIDSFFDNRQTTDNTNVSFSGLINVLDGVMSSGNGLLIFITVNDVSKLDKALVRPGRVDLIINFDYPKKREIKELFDSLTEDSNDKFEEFYDKIKNVKITMSGIVDFLFKNPKNYLSNINEFISQAKLYSELIEDKSDKMYL